MDNGKATIAEDFLQDFDRVTKARQEFAGHLFRSAEIIAEAERDAPAKLELQPQVEMLNKTALSLKEGVFRLLVLGDMKRGKSTFLNALLGELILPSDVNPCTAILTKLRYGKQGDVTVHFTDGKPPQSLSLADFKTRYTIPPDEAKRYEQEGRMAFPDVSHAEIQYPLPLLEKGVEIIDSPGLNDTEQRNEMSLSYVQNSHAILFVLSAVQQFTLGERRYLENYMRGKGLPVFYLINMWDEIRRRMLDPDDPDGVRREEEKVRQFFRTNLGDDLVVNGRSLYNQRVFEISALNAVRARLGRAGYGWEESGLAAFVNALTHFLTHDRALAEMQLARLTARNASRVLNEKCSLQISMLAQSTEELKEKINAVQPEFGELTNIARQFNEEIVRLRNKTADEVTNSFREYFTHIDETFEEDFTRYAPEIGSLEFLRKGKREEFQQAMSREFEHYLMDRIADWSKTAEVKLQTAFAELSRKAARYAVSYTEVTSRITATLTAESATPKPQAELLEESPLWQRLLAGGLAVATGDFAGGMMAGSGIFNWKRIFANVGIVLGVSTVLYAVLGVALTPIGASLVGLALGGWQMNIARRKFFESAKGELAKKLPAMVEQGGEKIYQSVYQQFTDYSQEVFKLLSADIDARKEQLDNLLREREARDIDISRETARLQRLMNDVDAERHKVELAFDRLLSPAQPVTV